MRLSFLLFFLLTGCATPSVRDGLAEIRTGMDKDQVLSLAGNPKRTFHKKAQDHWIFEYFDGNQMFEKKIVFQSGLVVDVGPVTTKKVTQEVPAVDDDLDQYEKQVRDKRKENAGEFKDID